MDNWYCIHTKPKKEDLVSKRLEEGLHLEVLNPKKETKRSLRGEIQVAKEELFPCYIFSKFNLEEHYHMIKYTPGIRRILGDNSGNPYIIDEETIKQIQDGYKPNDFNKGEKLEVIEGPFKGFNGIFQKKLKAKDRVMILLSTIASKPRIRVEIDREFLKKA